MATKSLNPEQKERAIAVFKRVLRDKFENNASRMAVALEIAQPTLWDIVNKGKGAGGKSLNGLYAIEPTAYGEIMGSDRYVLTAPHHGAMAVADSAQVEPGEVGLTQERVAARLQLPPYEYRKKQAETLAAGMQVFYQEAGIDKTVDDLASMADHNYRSLKNLPPRAPPPRSAPASVPPGVEGAFVRKAAKLRNHGGGMGRRNTGKKR